MKPKGLVSKRGITKSCPECENQLPTACKTCNCGYVFRRNTPSTSSTPPDSEILNRRRTGRVKKEPNYFNTMEYEQHFKRRRRMSSTTATEELAKKKKIRNKPLAKPPVLHKPKDVNIRPSITDTPASSSCDTPQQRDEKSRTPPEDVYGGITNEKALQYSIILAEINRKFLGQTFNPT